MIRLPKPEAVTNSSGGKREIQVLGFADRRKLKERVGHRPGLLDWAIRTDQDVNEWLASRVTAELQRAGFRVIANDPNASAIKIKGQTLLIWERTELSDLGHHVIADVTVYITMTSPDGTGFADTYQAQEVDFYWFLATERNHQDLLIKVLDTLMEDMIPDLVKKLDRMR